ncbi:MAG TPA: TlpA disulfide reductase family protein [Gemmatimonadales bacterium]|nr:TlpA disulfide reductase family protein [Gemmatimonadales bacterium]
MRIHAVQRVAAGASLLVVLGSCRQKPADAGAFRPLDVGSEVPAYIMPSLRGDTVRLGSPQPVTVLNVWATWCPSCREEMSTLDGVEKRFRKDGVRVVGVSVDRGASDRVRRYVAEQHLDFAIVHDPEGIVLDRFRIPAVPTTLVIDSSGVLRWEHTGNIADIVDQVDAEIEGLLSRTRAS